MQYTTYTTAVRNTVQSSHTADADTHTGTGAQEIAPGIIITAATRVRNEIQIYDDNVSVEEEDKEEKPSIQITN